MPARCIAGVILGLCDHAVRFHLNECAQGDGREEKDEARQHAQGTCQERDCRCPVRGHVVLGGGEQKSEIRDGNEGEDGHPRATVGVAGSSHRNDTERVAQTEADNHVHKHEDPEETAGQSRYGGEPDKLRCGGDEEQKPGRSVWRTGKALRLSLKAIMRSGRSTISQRNPNTGVHQLLM